MLGGADDCCSDQLLDDEVILERSDLPVSESQKQEDLAGANDEDLPAYGIAGLTEALFTSL